MTDHRPILIVIAGPNGSGKTTITSKILRHEWLEDAVYINPDQIAQERFGDWNSQEAVLQAAQYCTNLFGSTIDRVDFPRCKGRKICHLICFFYLCKKNNESWKFPKKLLKLQKQSI